MSTSSSSSSPSPYVIPNTVNDSDPMKTALLKGYERQHLHDKIVNVSKNGGGGHKKRKITKTKMSRRKLSLSLRKRISRKLRKSFKKTARKSRLSKRYKKLRNVKGGSTITIPSFNASPNATISSLASNHAQTLAYSSFDSAVNKAPSSPISSPLAP